MVGPPPRSTLFPYTTLFRSGSLRDGGELWRVDKAVRRAPIGMVQRIEGLTANFHGQAFGQHERTDQREIHRLHARPVDGISSDVAEGVRDWRAERGRIEPFRRCSRTGAENCLAIVVGAYGILTYDRS